MQLLQKPAHAAFVLRLLRREVKEIRSGASQASSVWLMACICEAMSALLEVERMSSNPVHQGQLSEQHATFEQLLDLAVQLASVGVGLECNAHVLTTTLTWAVQLLEEGLTDVPSFVSDKVSLRFLCTLLAYIRLEAHRSTVCGDAPLFLHIMKRYHHTGTRAIS